MSHMQIYQSVTARIIAAIEAGGIAPWRKPWVSHPANAPRNAATGTHYRGINVLLLASAGYAESRWMTLKQANALGGEVRRGERGTPIVLWKWVETQKTPGQSEDKQVPFLRQYTVFNAAQVVGMALPPIVNEPRKDLAHWDAADALVRGYDGVPKIVYGGSHAAYAPALDTVWMPRAEDFSSMAGYYNTLFHELTHSTGHVTRLNRAAFSRFVGFGTEPYSKEELIAEMGAAFLCGAAGIEAGHDQNAAYISGWLAALRCDNKLIFQAAGQAQRAVDYILGRHNIG